MKIVCVSDLHVGSKVFNHEQFYKFLTELSCDILVLNGDVLDSSNVRLNKTSWKVLSRLRKISDTTKIVWVKGNHDFDAEPVAHIIGAEFCDYFIFKKILFIHGDEFDDFVTKRKRLTKTADILYRTVQKFSKKIALLLKTNSKTFLRNSEKVKTGAVQKMKDLGCEFVCCGHTHHSENSFVYFNTGSWTEKSNMFIEVNHGFIKLLTYENK